MRTALVAYLAALLALGILDGLWLGAVARDWYRQGMGALMAEQPRIVPAALFYLGYPIGVVFFAALPAGGDLGKALALGAAFGLFCYGTYDLTAWAVLRGYPGWLAALDIAWGTSVTAVGTLAAAWAARHWG